MMKKESLSAHTFPGQIQKTSPDRYQGQISSKGLKTPRNMPACLGPWPVGKDVGSRLAVAVAALRWLKGGKEAQF